MNYVDELKPIEFLPKEFLDELNRFFVNSDLSKTQRKELVGIIEKNITKFN